MAISVFLTCGGLGGRQQCRPGINGRWLFLIGALHFEIEIDLRGETKCHRVHWRQIAEFQCVRSRIEAIVDLVVPTSRMIALSLSSGWLRTSHRMAFGRS